MLLCTHTDIKQGVKLMKWALNHPTKFKHFNYDANFQEQDHKGATINYRAVFLAFFIGFM